MRLSRPDRFPKPVWSPSGNGTVTWDGTYEDENGETQTIDKEGAPYEFVVMAFCGEDPEILKDELNCGLLGIQNCTMKEFLYNEDETRQKLRDETGDSVLVVFSHDGFTIEYKERTATERMLYDIKDANLNGTEQIDISEYYNSSKPTYKETVILDETQIDLMVIHTYLWEGDRLLHPLSENVSENNTDGTYKKGIKFEGDGSKTLLKLRTKTSEKMEILEEYLFLKTFDTETMDTESQDIIDDVEADSILDPIAACNICVRKALRRIANDEVLYPIHLNDYSGKISVLGKANDIYNDFLRWYYPAQYNNSSFVDDLLQDNIDWMKDECLDDADTQEKISECNEKYDNKSIEDYRSELEISEFEKVEANLTVEDGGRQYNIPNYNKLQKLANKGAFIIGVRKNEEVNSEDHYSSGHIVMLLPFDEDSEDDEGRGTTRANSGIDIEYPYAMECGDDYKRQGWLGDESFLKMKWYIYK